MSKELLGAKRNDCAELAHAADSRQKKRPFLHDLALNGCSCQLLSL